MTNNRFKHIPTKKLLEIISNDFVSHICTDYGVNHEEQLTEALWTRTNRTSLDCVKEQQKQILTETAYLDYIEALASIPPQFPFYYCPKSQTYLPIEDKTFETVPF